MAELRNLRLGLCAKLRYFECAVLDLLPTKKKIDNIDVVSPILKRYRNDNDISKFRYFS